METTTLERVALTAILFAFGVAMLGSTPETYGAVYPVVKTIGLIMTVGCYPIARFIQNS